MPTSYRIARAEAQADLIHLDVEVSFQGDAAQDEEAHRNWFAAEFPGTFADMQRDEMSARVIFAHSETAWLTALSAERDARAALDDKPT
jgi:hypothetical protein